MPPLTPSNTRAPRRVRCPAPAGVPVIGLLDRGGGLGWALPFELALVEFLPRDGEGLAVGAGVDHRRDELPDALAELRVVAVDLPGAPGRQDHQGVLRVHPCEQVVDLRFDHARNRSPREFGAESRHQPRSYAPTAPGWGAPGGGSSGQPVGLRLLLGAELRQQGVLLLGAEATDTARCGDVVLLHDLARTDLAHAGKALEDTGDLHLADGVVVFLVEDGRNLTLATVLDKEDD